MNSAWNPGRSTVGLLCLTALVACGDSDITCPEGQILVGDECVLVGDGGPTGDDLGPSPSDMGGTDGPAPMDGGASCTPSDETDVPDGEFADTDCDGFDGDLDLAVAVVPSGASAPDGVAASEETITQAIATAESEGLTQIWVASGDWTETITLVSGISIFGAYDPDDDWQRTRTLGRESRIFGPGPLLVGEGIDEATTVALMELAADDAAAGENSVAARLVSSSGVRLEDMRLAAGRGGDGTSLSRPARASGGSMGTSGGMTGLSEDCLFGTPRARAIGGSRGAACSGCYAGGRGGATSGGSTSAGTANDGEGGGDGSSFVIGGVRTCSFGAAGNGGPAPGGDGDVGATGDTGDDGDGSTGGAFAMDGFVPGNGSDGTTGRAGFGGGGGAAAADVEHPSVAGCVYFGASGGGGGGGGCGGEGGPGGTGGGASVALWLWDSTVTLISVTLVSDDGGDGGDGALGGEGGPGGPGSDGGPAASGGGYPTFLTFGAGGDGGPGGEGGQGGAGGGGAGGPSIGIVFGGDSSEGVASMDISFELGAGGAAGLGAGTDNDGAVGAIVERFDPEG